MANEAKHITELPVAATAATDSVFVIEVNVGNTSSNSVTKQISVTNLFSNSNLDISANTITLEYNTTPANSTINVVHGRIWYDSDYLYVATANNVVKRVPLEDF